MILKVGKHAKWVVQLELAISCLMMISEAILVVETVCTVDLKLYICVCFCIRIPYTDEEKSIQNFLQDHSTVSVSKHFLVQIQRQVQWTAAIRILVWLAVPYTEYLLLIIQQNCWSNRKIMARTLSDDHCGSQMTKEQLELLGQQQSERWQSSTGGYRSSS
uniref:DUF3402 domain-containing protein n=1 Tax=Syphacia muris TaxID=451379 RepID=A0A0N5AZ75_9BILA